MTETKLNLTKENWIKVLKGTGIASTGAIVDYLSMALLKFDYGEWSALVYVAVPVLVNMARKLIAQAKTQNK